MALQNDPEFIELFNRLFPKLKQAIFFMTQDDDLAQQASIDTLARVWQNMDKIPEIKNLDAWVHKIAENATKNLLRLRKRWFRIPPIDPETATAITETLSPIGNPDQKDEEIILRSALRQLDRRDRQLIFMRYYQGFDEGTMAEVLNRKRGTIKSQLHRALQRLRRMYDRSDKG